MASNAMTTVGVKLQKGDGATGTELFTTVAEITKLNGPSQTAKLIDVTSLDSTAREYRSGLKDGGDVSFDVNLVASSHKTLKADFDAHTVRNFKLLLTDHATTPSTAAFSAIITEFGITSDVDNVVKAAIKLKVTGDVVWTWVVGA